MTVKELREQLANYPDDMQVLTRVPHCCGQGNMHENAWFTPEVKTLKVKQVWNDSFDDEGSYGDSFIENNNQEQEILGIEGT